MPHLECVPARVRRQPRRPVDDVVVQGVDEAGTAKAAARNVMHAPLIAADGRGGGKVPPVEARAAVRSDAPPQQVAVGRRPHPRRTSVASALLAPNSPLKI